MIRGGGTCFYLCVLAAAGVPLFVHSFLNAPGKNPAGLPPKGTRGNGHYRKIGGPMETWGWEPAGATKSAQTFAAPGLLRFCQGQASS